MKNIIKHKPGCSTNLNCLVYHEDGICPGYKDCDCGVALPRQENKECCEKCRHHGDCSHTIKSHPDEACPCHHTPRPTEEWEELFEEDFSKEWVKEDSYLRRSYGAANFDGIVAWMKAYIFSLLAQQKAEIIKKVERMKKDKNFEMLAYSGPVSREGAYSIPYNQAIDDLISLLTNE